MSQIYRRLYRFHTGCKTETAIQRGCFTDFTDFTDSFWRGMCGRATFDTLRSYGCMCLQRESVKSVNCVKSASPFAVCLCKIPTTSRKVGCKIGGVENGGC